MKKEGLIDFDVSAEEFKASGWHIPRAELTKRSLIGKGEYGGEFCEEDECAVKKFEERLVSNLSLFRGMAGRV